MEVIVEVRVIVGVSVGVKVLVGLGVIVWVGVWVGKRVKPPLLMVTTKIMIPIITNMIAAPPRISGSGCFRRFRYESIVFDIDIWFPVRFQYLFEPGGLPVQVCNLILPELRRICERD